MKHLIISDVHGDINALNRLDEIPINQYDDIWFLGDALGYCTIDEGVQCIDWLVDHDAKCIRGNWEWWILTPKFDPKNEVIDGKQDLTRAARLEVIRNYRENLPHEYLLIIEKWPEFIEFPTAKATIYHGSPFFEHTIGHINSSTQYFEQRFNEFIFCGESVKVNTPLLFLGHSHNSKWFPFSPNLMDCRPFFLLNRENFPRTVRTKKSEEWHCTFMISTIGREQRNGFPSSYVIYDDEAMTVKYELNCLLEDLP